MKRFAITTIATVYLSVFPTISSAIEDNFGLGVSLLRFDYAEYLNGQFLDGELGLVPGFYTSYTTDISDRSYIKLIGTFYFGEVDYDGETQGAGIPVKSTSDTKIIDTYFIYGRRLDSRAKSTPSYSIFGGLGYRYWRRNIHDTQTPAGNPVAGVREFYDWFYFNVGVNGQIAKADGVTTEFNIHLTRMMHAKIEIDYLGFQNQDNNSLNLGERWGLYISIPIKFRVQNHNWTVEPFYRQWDIGRSNTEPITSGGVPTGQGVFEPRSETRNFGIHVYYTINL